MSAPQDLLLVAEGEVVDVGVDGGGLDDLLGFAVLGRHKAPGEHWMSTHAWALPVVLECLARTG